jgi:hypothetical protein
MHTDCSTSMQQRTNVLLDGELFQQQSELFLYVRAFS